MPGAFLNGLRVVTLEQAVAAPFCSRRLAQAGANVIKVERPEGDFARGYDAAVHGQSAYFAWLNYGKRSVVVDFKLESGVEALKTLIASADVFIQNLKPGALAKAGVDLAAIRRENTSLITCSVAGYAAAGPSAQKKAYDLLIQAETGLASITGSPHAPGRVGVSVVDIACGHFAYEAILGALLERAQTGAGQALEVTLFDALSEWMAVPYLLERYGGAAPERVGLAHPGIAPYGVFTAADGVEFVLAVQNEREWARLCETVLGDAAFASGEQTSTNALRVAHRNHVDSTVQRAVGARSYADVSARLTEADIAHAPVNDVAALKDHADFQTVAIRMGDDEALMPRTPGHVPPEIAPRLPAVGEHTEEVFRELELPVPSA